MTGQQKADFMQRTYQQAQARQAALDRAMPPRKHGLMGMVQDVTTGRGLLGLATTGGPVALLARPAARTALFHGHIGKAFENAVRIGRYQPTDPTRLTGKRQEASVFGIPLSGHFQDIAAVAGNALNDINQMPSGFVDMAHVLGNSMIYDATHPPKGKPGLGHAAWFAKDSQTSKTFQQLGLGTAKQFRDMAVHPERAATEHPVNTVLNAAIVLGPLARIGGIAALGRSLSAANELSTAEALRAATAESFRPGTAALQGLKGGIDRRGAPTPTYPEGVPFRSSRSPFGRVLQKQYDWSTSKLPDHFLLSMGRKSRRAEAKTLSLARARIQRDANAAARVHALYVNEGLLKKGRAFTGDELRRGRDQAVGLAIQGAKSEPAINSVRLALQDTQRILGDGRRVAQKGDLSDLPEELIQPGQEAFLRDERVTVTDVQPDGTLTVRKPDGSQVDAAAHQLKLIGPGDVRVKIPLQSHEVEKLTQRATDLNEAIKELEANPDQLARFEKAVGAMTNLGDINERFGQLIATERVPPEEWAKFIEGGTLRKNLMARRWRQQGLRATPEVQGVLDNPARTQFVQETTQRFGDRAEPLIQLADNMAQAAADRGAMTDPAEWWSRIASTTSGRAEDFTGSALYQEAGRRQGLLMGNESQGAAIPGALPYRGKDGTWWWGVTDHGDGTVRAWSDRTGWVDNLASDEISRLGVGGYAGRNIGERVAYQPSFDRGPVFGRVTGYHETTQGPKIEMVDANGDSYFGAPSDFQSAEPDVGEPIFYSKAQQTIADPKFPEKQTPQQAMKALEKAGVKPDEMFWTGLNEFMQMYPGKTITKDELLAHLENSLNGVNLDEMVYSSLSGDYPDRWGPSSSYSDTGLIIRDPTREEPYYELVMQLPNVPGGPHYTSGHWSGLDNPIFHVRFHVLTAEDGVRSILIDELQSDLHAAGRRQGYQQPIPPEVQARIDDLQKRLDVVSAQRDQITGDRYAMDDVTRDARNALVKQRADEAVMAHPEAAPYFSKHEFERSLHLNTNWKDPEVVAQLEQMFPGYTHAAEGTARHQRISELENAIQRDMSSERQPYVGGMPDFPFKNNAWVGLAMKRLVRWAADDGQIDRLMWTTGHEHMVRYGKSDPAVGEGGGPEEPPDEFYYQTGDVNEQRGAYYGGGDYFGAQAGQLQHPIPELTDISPGPQRIGDVTPVQQEVSLDDLASEDVGERYAFHDGRYAKILDYNPETDAMVLQNVPIQSDPHSVGITYYGHTGGESGGSYNVIVTNRLGEKIVDWQDSIYTDPYQLGGNLFDEIRGQAFTPGDPGYEALQILADSPWARDLVERELDRNLSSEFDQYAYDEWRSEYGGSGDFESVKNGYSDPNDSHNVFYGKVMPGAADKTFKNWKIKTRPYENIYSGRYSAEGGGTTDEGLLNAFGFDIPPEMKQSVLDAKQSLFQKPITGDGLPRGAMELLKGAMDNPEQVGIRLFQGADPSTVIHELAHIGLYDLSPRDISILEQELQGGVKRADWGTTEYERFARGFENYLHTGTAGSNLLQGVFQRLAKLVQATYHAVKDHFGGQYISPQVQDVFDRMVVPGSHDEARAYFPHRSQYETQLQDFMGGVRLPAGGQTIGRPKMDARAFPHGENAQVLWESGDLNNSPRALVSQYVARHKFRETQQLRRHFWQEGHDIRPGQPAPPPGSWLVRNPDAPTETITARTRAATTLDEQSYRELSGDPGFNDWSSRGDMVRSWLAKTGRDTPPWVGDYRNVRWIEPEKVTSLVEQVFPSAPRGKGAATMGILNATSRMAQIYLRPIRYITGNLPANVILQALTHPASLPRAIRPLAASIRNAAGEFGRGPAELARTHPGLYDAIKVEAGDVQAQAGLPEFYSAANNAFQSSERRLNRWSSELADRLGEVSDQPFRVAVWQSWAKRYGFKTPDDWQRLISSSDPATMRIRDEISQRTREDMIDFNTITPSERQHITRFFYLWAFTRGFIKWPLTFVREYPERAGVISALSNAGVGTQDEPYPGAWNDPRIAASMPGPMGTRWDISSWAPASGAVEAANSLWGLLHGDVSPLVNYMNPAVSLAGKSAFDPIGQKGWGYWGQQIAANYIPPALQAAVPGITPARSRQKQPNAITDLIGRIPVVGGPLAAIDPYTSEFGRFARPRYSPGNFRKYQADVQKMKANVVALGNRVPAPRFPQLDPARSLLAYNRKREYESRLMRGIVAREGRSKLSNLERAVIDLAVLQETDPAMQGKQLPSEAQLSKQPDAWLGQYADSIEKYMFTARSELQSAATRAKNEAAKRRQQAQVQR